MLGGPSLHALAALIYALSTPQAPKTDATRIDGPDYEGWGGGRL
ncbi:hypothetical protein [Streptomyces zaomyceticus]